MKCECVAIAFPPSRQIASASSCRVNPTFDADARGVEPSRPGDVGNTDPGVVDHSWASLRFTLNARSYCSLIACTDRQSVGSHALMPGSRQENA